MKFGILVKLKDLYRTWTYYKIKKIIIRRLKSEIKKISNIQSL